MVAQSTMKIYARALRRKMHPLTPSELGDDFDLDETLGTSGAALWFKSHF